MTDLEEKKEGTGPLNLGCRKKGPKKKRGQYLLQGKKKKSLVSLEEREAASQLQRCRGRKTGAGDRL